MQRLPSWFATTSSRSLRVEPLEDRCLLAVFSVTNLDDSGSGSLRAAVLAANAAEGPDEITFAVPGTISLTSQLPVITDTLTITGLGADQTVLDAGNGSDGEFSTGDGYRLIDINDGDSDSTISVTLQGLTLTGGDVEIPVTTDSRGVAGEDGGAIRSFENLTLVDSVVTGNAAGTGSDGDLVKYCITTTSCYYGYYGYRTEFPGAGGRGGGIWIEGADLVINSSTISGNRSGNGGLAAPAQPSSYSYAVGAPGGHGGGIGVADGSATITGSLLRDNQTGRWSEGAGQSGPDASGGGLHVEHASVRVTDSHLEGNSAKQNAGGISITDSDVAILRSTISGNAALGSAGGIGMTGFFKVSGGHDLSLENSTVSGNIAESYAAISYFGGTAIITRSTITENANYYGDGEAVFISGQISGSIIAGNGSRDLRTDLLEVTNSLIGLVAGDTLLDGENGNQVGSVESPIDPRLGPLAENGGPTPTHALLPGSPAIDAGDPNAMAGIDGVPLDDQRGEGFSRVVGGRIDIGAVEVDLPPAPATGGDFNWDGVVDLLDDQTWRDTYGATVDPFTGADANGNGRIDSADYTVWRDHFTPRDVDIPQTSSAPIIDGSPDSLWQEVPAEEINSTVFGSIDSDADASATWRAVWDETAFYIYAEIVDQRLVRDSSIAFDDDGLEAFFDFDLSQQASYDGVDDTQYMFRIADSHPVSSPNSPAGATEGVIYATGGNPNGAGYTIEAAIPWTALDAAPQAGHFFGLEFALQDDDDGGGIGPTGTDGRRQWFGTSNRAFFDPRKFGVAALSPQIVGSTEPVFSAGLTPTEAPESTLSQGPVSLAALDEGFALPVSPRARFRTPARDSDGARHADLLLVALAIESDREELDHFDREDTLGRDRADPPAEEPLLTALVEGLL